MHTTPLNRRRPALVLLVILAAFFSPRAALAQPDLVTENAELKARVKQLEAELDLATRRLRALNNEVVQLRKRLNEPAPTEQPDAPPTTAPAAGPRLAPSALLAALKERYDASLADTPKGTRAEQIRFQREAADWARAVEQELSGDTAWLVRITDGPTPSPRGARVTVDVLSPGDGKTLDSAVQLTLNPRLARDLTAASSHKVWTFSGPLRVTPQVNMRRSDDASSGPNDPPLAGPFVEMAYDFTVSSVARAAAPAAP